MIALRKNNTKAFSLVEMMIAIAIVIIVVTLVLPGMIRARMVAYEGAAIANLKIISNACQLYQINNAEFPDALTEMTESDPPYLDDVLASGFKGRYRFTYEPVDDGFELHADPTGFLATFKAKQFYTDDSGTITSKVGGQAGPDDEIAG